MLIWSYAGGMRAIGPTEGSTSSNSPGVRSVTQMNEADQQTNGGLGSVADCGLSVARSSEKPEIRILMFKSPYFHILVTNSQLLKHFGLSKACLLAGFTTWPRWYSFWCVTPPQTHTHRAPPTTWEMAGGSAVDGHWFFDIALTSCMSAQLPAVPFLKCLSFGVLTFFPNDRCTYFLYT